MLGQIFHSIFLLTSFTRACQLITSYNDCVNKNTLKIMSCEALNSGPMYDYYTCICAQKKALFGCYTICADDPTLQLESQTAQLDVIAVCQQASQLQPTSTTTTLPPTTTTISTTTRPPPP